MKPAREPASSHPKPCASLKNPHESCPFAAPCGPRRKKNDRGQRSAFPSETSRFALSILAHRGSALPWLVNDRAALRLRRISVCVFFPFILDIKFVGRNSRGHTGGRSHRIFHPPSFCGACFNFSREKDSAIPFPRRL